MHNVGILAWALAAAAAPSRDALVDNARLAGEYLFGWRQAASQFLALGLAIPRRAGADRRTAFANVLPVDRFEIRNGRLETPGDGHRAPMLPSPERPGQSARVCIRNCGETARILGVERTW